MAYTQVTEAERERLEMLIEECSEVIQCCTKILRHGYNSFHPNDPTTSNNSHLEKEIHDVLAILNEMKNREDIVISSNINTMGKRWQKKLKWTHHQED